MLRFAMARISVLHTELSSAGGSSHFEKLLYDDAKEIRVEELPLTDVSAHTLRNV